MNQADRIIAQEISAVKENWRKGNLTTLSIVVPKFFKACREEGVPLDHSAFGAAMYDAKMARGVVIPK